MVGDVLRETFEVDSKVFRTLKLLPKPGRLSVEFSRNRRASYVSPVRLYLFASVIYLFAVAQAQPDSGSNGDSRNRPAARDIGGDRYLRRFFERIAAHPGADRTPSSRGCHRKQRASWDDLMLRPDGPETIGFLLQISSDLPSRIPDETSGFERVWWTASIGFLHDPGFFQDQIVGSLSVGAIFFVPVAALMLALIYYRKKRYFAEHLVFQIHVQTFSFLLTAVAVSLPAGTLGALGRTALGGWALYYALAALKHFYRDGWLPTLFKVLLLILLNAVLITPILFAIIALRM